MLKLINPLNTMKMTKVELTIKKSMQYLLKSLRKKKEQKNSKMSKSIGKNLISTELMVMFEQLQSKRRLNHTISFYKIKLRLSNRILLKNYKKSLLILKEWRWMLKTLNQN
jgi:hypothetical protein